jgi:hypothetical protein
MVQLLVTDATLLYTLLLHTVTLLYTHTQQPCTYDTEDGQDRP